MRRGFGGSTGSGVVAIVLPAAAMHRRHVVAVMGGGLVMGDGARGLGDSGQQHRRDGLRMQQRDEALERQADGGN